MSIRTDTKYALCVFCHQPNDQPARVCGECGCDHTRPVCTACMERFGSLLPVGLRVKPVSDQASD